MLLKIFTAKRDVVDADDTGTYADGYHMPELDIAAYKRSDRRSSYERDYGRGRKAEEVSLGLV
ncbi:MULTISPECIES: hypothetical protein [Rhizobium]|uniref:Uncharacterized protein n=1 Tax=Rhizobium metallidurans TaxID=1265931 RepID=A0A7W6CWW5_9HYPH|nr:MULTISPECIES: hypothetical protein [Rhizobium]MBB3965974.1 hypothetical protein [Rhizobium metallidurans]